MRCCCVAVSMCCCVAVLLCCCVAVAVVAVLLVLLLAVSSRRAVLRRAMPRRAMPRRAMPPSTAVSSTAETQPSPSHRDRQPPCAPPFRPTAAERRPTQPQAGPSMTTPASSSGPTPHSPAPDHRCEQSGAYHRCTVHTAEHRTGTHTHIVERRERPARVSASFGGALRAPDKHRRTGISKPLQLGGEGHGRIKPHHTRPAHDHLARRHRDNFLLLLLLLRKEGWCAH
jgi:hypothetical protein